MRATWRTLRQGRPRLGLLALAAALLAALALPAVASAAQFNLTVHKVGTGAGKVTCEITGSGSPGPCASTIYYPEGTQLTLVASPDPGSEFVEWSEACFGSEPTCELTIEESQTVTAEFALIPEFPLTVNTTGGTGTGKVTCEVSGSGSAEPCASKYLKGTELTLVALPDPGSEFVELSGGCISFEPTCELTMEEPQTVTATFALIPEFPLTVNTTGGPGAGTVRCEVSGSGSAGPCAAKYPEGTELTLVASPDPGSEFVEWSEACFGSEPTCQLTMEGPQTVIATFDLRPGLALAVSTSGTGAGTVECAFNGGPAKPCPGTATPPEGIEVTLTATPGPNSTFAGFSGEGAAGGCTTSPCTFTLGAEAAVTATFNKEEAKPPPPEGTAQAAATAKVKGGRALLKLTCSGGACRGTLQLTARLRQGKKTKSLVIGKASFSLASGASTTLKVKLSAAAKKALAKGRTLKAKLTGTGIAGSTVKLRPAR